MLSQNFVYVPRLSKGAACPSYFMLFIWWPQQNFVTMRSNIQKSRAKILHPSILSGLQPWGSLGLLINQCPSLSIFHLLHPVLYLNYFQICYNIVLTLQVGIIKSDFQISFINICFSSFRV